MAIGYQFDKKFNISLVELSATCFLFFHMKTLKVYEDVHRGIKVAAAESGRTTTNTASELLRVALELVAKGKIKLSKLPTVEAGQ